MSKKNLLMITKVKNEADIIESFIRYHSYIFDKIVVIDNGSIDGTYEILKALKKENLPIEIVNEGASDFDAFRLANQYTKKYIQAINADFVTFMDADEFLIADHNENPRNIIERLDEDRIYYLHWKTYLYNNEKNEKEYMPSNFFTYRDETLEEFTKIIVPGRLLEQKQIIVTEGNHDVICDEKIESEFIKKLKFAHFPVRSSLQYKKQILLNVIDIMSNPNVNQHTGSHWKKMYQITQNRIDLYQKSLEYAFYKGTTTYVNEITDIFEIEKDIKYKFLAKNDLQQLLLIHAEIQSLKLKMERIKNSKIVGSIEKILVYGTGALCHKRVGRIDENKYEIIAFVDSDYEKQFLTLNGKVIITPDKMRFFEFDKIIVASEKYAKDIKEVIFQELPMIEPQNIINIERFIIDQYQ